MGRDVTFPPSVSSGWQRSTRGCIIHLLLSPPFVQAVAGDPLAHGSSDCASMPSLAFG
ncbi:hypothetical protein ASPCADRAFT_209862 [Aspergillus carbonarius ITEM 5010]|uniref:Uncharacterized protein n=1 Tax=Aspergillus carbonarius (strain ITEM 5010) TaxID=602072 RepID=A0A1R3RFK9_ASPC5|nr:hypothetical protein ASPCADRAFT_209862 [Aspergillus carbonarius ITEM 5010]